MSRLNRLFPKQLQNQVLRSRQGILFLIPLTAPESREKLSLQCDDLDNSL